MKYANLRLPAAGLLLRACRTGSLALLTAAVLGCPSAQQAALEQTALDALTLSAETIVGGTDRPVGSEVRVTAFVGSGVQTALVPTSGQSLTWRVASGGGTVAVETNPTDGTGRGAVKWTLGSAPGPQTLTVTLRESLNPLHTRTYTVNAFTNAVDRITVTPNLALTLGASAPVVVTLFNSISAPITGRAFTATSSNPAVARVDLVGANVTVTALAVGTADVIVQSEGKEGRASVTVTPRPVASLVLTPDAATIAVGETVRLTALVRDAIGTVLTDRPVTYGSLNTFAVVDATGLVRGISIGEGLITASAEGKADTSRVSVVSAACPATGVCTVTISTNQNRTSVQVGHTLLFQTILRDAAGNQITTGATVTYSSSNPAIARVDPAAPGGPPGYFADIVGVGAGQAIITATAGGRSGTFAISVTP